MKQSTADNFVYEELGCIHYVLPGGGEDFLGGYKNFQNKIGGIGNFKLILRGISNFLLILINSVGLHYQLIYHLPQIFNTEDVN